MAMRNGFQWGFAWCVLFIAMSITVLVIGLVIGNTHAGTVMSLAGALSTALGLVALFLRQTAIAFIGLLVSACGGMVAAGLTQAAAFWSPPMLTAGLLGLVGLGLLGAMRVLASQPGAGMNPASMEDVLHQLQETSMLSDTAKRIIFRDRELSLIRRTIQEDIDRGDFNAGLVLCGDMESLFGYSEEAEQLRQRVLLARNSQLAVRIGDDVAEVDQLLEAGRIDEAEMAAIRLQRMYPDSPSLHGLDARVRARRSQAKRELKSDFIHAAERGEAEHAMELLRQLDRQLSSVEASEIHEAAATVIAQHRDALSVRFKMAVSDHRWPEAIEAGEQIITDFPNDRMATEVRGMLDRLRERACVEQEAGSA
ncbi:MAG: hypothetical protein MK100_02370 [Phycisphaerales bacterium]|nr:hypothetical protein [Phycisphaerales bacterium]